MDLPRNNRLVNFGGKKSAIEIDSSIWREEIQNRNRLVNNFGGKKFKIEIDSSILAGRNGTYIIFSSSKFVLYCIHSIMDHGDGEA